MRDLIKEIYSNIMDEKINNIDGREIYIQINKNPTFPPQINNMLPKTYKIYADVSNMSEEYYGSSTSNKRSDISVLINIKDLEDIKNNGDFVILPPKKMQDYKVLIRYNNKIYSIKDEQIVGFGTQIRLTIGFDA